MRRRSGYPCTRCGGQMFFERDLLHRHVACKCLQCGYIAAYFWTEPGDPKPQVRSGRPNRRRHGVARGLILAPDVLGSCHNCCMGVQ